MTDEDDPTSIGRYDWERLVKRARMAPSTKLVALAVATYASKGGESMYPGVEKLAAVTGLTGKTVRAALRTLREDLRLLERTFEGSKNGRRGLADEYRLRRPCDIERRTHMLDPAESTRSASCHDGCQHPRTGEVSSGDPAPQEGQEGQEQGNSVPGTGELSSRTGELSSPNRGSEFPPPSHDHPRNHPLDQREDQLSDVTTGGDLYEKLAEIDRLSLARQAR